MDVRRLLRFSTLILVLSLLMGCGVLERCRAGDQPPMTPTPSPTQSNGPIPTATTPSGDDTPETVTPTPTEIGTPAETVTPSPTVVAQLSIERPADGDIVFSPAGIGGTVSQMPFESQLSATIRDEGGTVVGEGGLMATPDDPDDMTGSGTFSGTIPFTVTQVVSGLIEVLEPRMGEEGPPVMSDTVDVTLIPEGITIVLPEDGDTVFTPVRVRGFTSTRPFEATLRGRVYDAGGNVVGEGPVMVTPIDEDTIWGPGTFDTTIEFTIAAAGPGTVEVADISAKDGSVIASDTVDVTLAIGPK